MSYLLDTHTLLWVRLEPVKLSSKHRDILTKNNEPKYISTLTIWEISLKFALGKLNLGGHNPEEFLDSACVLGLQVIAPDPVQFASFYRLPAVNKHKDPFDRMLVWQAIQNNLTLLTQDKDLINYEKHGLQLVN